MKFTKETPTEHFSFSDIGYENISLSKTLYIEPQITKGPCQGDCWCSKIFKVGQEHKNRCVDLYFEAAMQVAEIWLNLKKSEVALLPRPHPAYIATGKI
ncbi:hypothetical protein UMM65_13765 [Aureibaculum sp. 2210JD6-5]|uniref:hypothetical protein n=1 Tax=Aureibaculum sp. 2210JD6-5 TaxID=3103957 RepID=UPI002AAD55E0|nr:hypothetical protein [Aureibaculum sp. 2210JD6-5]MDY7396313.1 hypothetical protein [Aureibaculum sp. 2210JD6-5]